MNDNEIDDLLRNVRPLAPPADLRARILAGSRPRRAWPWAAAAAALLLVAIGLETSAAHHRREVQRGTGGAVAAAEDQLLDVMRQTLGLTDVEVRALAMNREFERIVAQDAPQERRPQ